MDMHTTVLSVRTRGVQGSGRYVVLAGALALVPLAGASISRFTIATPGGLAQAGAYPTTCGCDGLTPGADLGAIFGTGAAFQEQSFAGNAGAAVSVSNPGPGTQGPLSQSMAGIAGLGYVRVQGSNAYTDYATFASAMFDGGWNETLTVNRPTLQGQAGFFAFQVQVGGTMHTQGLSGAALYKLQAFKNNAAVATNAIFNAGSADNQTPTDQLASWGLASYGLPDNRAVNTVVTFSIPITFGTPFTLGVYARALAGQRSSGGFNDPSSDWLNFTSPGVQWAGVSGFYNASGVSVSGATLVSGSGVNWVPPYSACDTIDFNGDGLFPDTLDIDDFISVFSGGPCSTGTCGDIDFNNDGLFPDTSDIDSLLSVFSGGACL